MAYRAEIEIGIRGAARLKDLQNRLKSLSTLIDENNSKPLFKRVAIQSVQQYSGTLALAKDNLNKVQIELDKAGKATGLYAKNIKEYAEALVSANDAQNITNRLVKEEVDLRTQATAALKAYNAAAVPPTQRGAQTTMAGAYLRGQPNFGPQPAPDFNPVAAAGRARASGLAAEAIKKGQGAQEAIRIINEVTEYQRRAFIDITNNKIQLTQKQLDAELDSIQTALDAAIKADKARQANFDRRLKAAISVGEQEAKLAQEQLKIEQSITKEKVKQSISRRKRIVENAKDFRRRRKEALGSAIIGGAFPLLFGQGPGAAIGGALGGGAGGLAGGQFGFGLSLVGTQLGVLVDQLVGKATNLGQALNTLTADIDAVIAASGKSNTKFAENIKALEDAGLKNTALELATQQLAQTIGSEGVKALKTFGSDVEQLSNTFARAITQMAASLASLVNSIGAVKRITEGLERSVLIGAAAGLAKSDPKIAAALKELQKERNTPAFGLKTLGVGGLVTAPATEAEEKVVRLVRENINRQVKNIEGLTKLALQEKENLDKAKLNLQNAERALQASSIVDKFTNQLKEQQKAQLDFEARRNDIVEKYEKSIATLRRNVENQISNLRLQNLRKANQLEDQRAANALADLRNQQAASRLFTAGSLGQDPAITQLEQNLQNAADTYSLRILEAEQKRAKLERDAALSVQEIGFRTDRFKLDVARQAAELSLNAQKQIDRINKNINQRNADFNAKKLKNEVRIAVLQLEVLQAEINFEAQKLNDEKKTATAGRSDEITNQIITLGLLYSALGDSIKELKQFKLPAAFTEVQGITQAAIDLSGYNKVVEESIGLQNQLNQSQLAAISTQLEAAGLASLKTASDALLQIENQVLGSLVARNLELEKTARITELTRELGSKALAEEIAGIEFATKAQLTKIQTIQQSLVAQQADLEAKIAANKATEQEIAQLERIKELLGQIGALKGTVNAASAALKNEAKGELDAFIEQTTEQLNNVQARAVRVAQGIGDAIGNSLTDGIVKLTEGSATVQEVFANLLRSVADVLIQESARMIAQYVALKLARDAALGASGGTGGVGGILGAILGFGGQYADGGRPPVGKASLVGERGPELFVPGRSGTIIPNDQLGGSSNTVTVNVDAKGTEVSGNSDQSRQLGTAISRAVQAELVKQQRPGGVLHSSR